MRRLLVILLAFSLGALSMLVVHEQLEGQPQPETAAPAAPSTTQVSMPPAGLPASGAAGVLAAAEALLDTGDLTPEEARDIAVFERTSPSVAYITSSDVRRDMFSLNVFEIPIGTGSGFVWDDQGHVVTNFHVVSNGRRFSVVLADQSEHDARLVGYAEDKDIAVLRIEAPREQLKPIRVGASARLRVGQRVLAIGNPFGLDHTLTIGVISALGRELNAPNGRTIRDVIQTDAAINPGNSGGPLLDSAGRLIGMSTAIYSPSGASAGIGFAVPIDTVKRLVPQLIEHGRPVRPGIGISLVPDRYVAQWRVDGLVVQEVTPGSPAARAGLEGLRMSRRGGVILGDRILAVDGQPLATVEDLLHTFEQAGVGKRVTLTVARDDARRTVEVTLDAIE